MRLWTEGEVVRTILGITGLYRQAHLVICLDCMLCSLLREFTKKSSVQNTGGVELYAACHAHTDSHFTSCSVKRISKRKIRD